MPCCLCESICTLTYCYHSIHLASPINEHSGVDIDGDTAGIAFLRTMCSDSNSVGVTQDGGGSLSSVASIAAHELGHIFNMNHDGTVYSQQRQNFHQTQLTLVCIMY